MNTQKVYAIRAPRSTHWRQASCAEADCQYWREGWNTYVDLNTELGKAQAEYIRRRSGRSFHETDMGGGGVKFAFDAGQRCFGSDRHQVRVERQELFIADGRQHVRPIDWVEDFATHLDRVTEDRKRG